MVLWVSVFVSYDLYDYWTWVHAEMASRSKNKAAFALWGKEGLLWDRESKEARVNFFANSYLTLFVSTKVTVYKNICFKILFNMK